MLCTNLMRHKAVLFEIEVVGGLFNEKGHHPLTTPMGLCVWGAVKAVEANFEECRPISVPLTDWPSL